MVAAVAARVKAHNHLCSLHLPLLVHTKVRRRDAALGPVLRLDSG